MRSSTFLRVHRSYLVNLEQVDNLQRGDGASGGVLGLANGRTVPVSRRLLPEVREAFLGAEGVQASERHALSPGSR